MRTLNQSAKEVIRPDSGKIFGAETVAERYRPPSPLLAQSNTQKLYLAGTHRDREPRNTVACVRKFYEKIGITRVANITGLDVLEIPVVSVIRPNARSISVSQGKGVNLDAAKASGVMEAAEIFHGENDGLDRCVASARELKAFEQYAVAINFPKKKNSRYRSDLEIQWTLAWDLMNHQPVWVPYETVHCRSLLSR